MFKVFFYNFGYSSQEQPATLEAAKELARKAGFQSTIYDSNDEPVVSFCPIQGFTDTAIRRTVSHIDHTQP